MCFLELVKIRKFVQMFIFFSKTSQMWQKNCLVKIRKKNSKISPKMYFFGENSKICSEIEFCLVKVPKFNQKLNFLVIIQKMNFLSKNSKLVQK